MAETPNWNEPIYGPDEKYSNYGCEMSSVYDDRPVRNGVTTQATHLNITADKYTYADGTTTVFHTHTYGVLGYGYAFQDMRNHDSTDKDYLAADNHIKGDHSIQIELKNDPRDECKEWPFTRDPLVIEQDLVGELTDTQLETVLSSVNTTEDDLDITMGEAVTLAEESDDLADYRSKVNEIGLGAALADAAVIAGSAAFGDGPSLIGDAIGVTTAAIGLMQAFEKVPEPDSVCKDPLSYSYTTDTSGRPMALQYVQFSVRYPEWSYNDTYVKHEFNFEDYDQSCFSNHKIHDAIDPTAGTKLTPPLTGEPNESKLNDRERYGYASKLQDCSKIDRSPCS